MIIGKMNVPTLAAFILILSACASGSSIVTGTVRQPINVNQVKLYLDAPENYETIGVVKASSDAGWNQQSSQDYAVEELKKQAAKLGANGVLLSATGENKSTIVGTHPNGEIYAIPITEQTVTGRAIFITE